MRYRLKKDLPDGKAGDVFKIPSFGNPNWYVGEKCQQMFHAATVENNPEWFEEIKEEPEQPFVWDDILAFGKKCFYKGFEKCEKDDANCYAAWRECAYDLTHNLSSKKSTPSKKEDAEWEIVEMRNKFGERHVGILEVGNDWTHYLSKSMWEINKVKRLSDGEVFSVGDSVISYVGLKKTIISLIVSPSGKNIEVRFSELPIDFNLLHDLKKPSPSSSNETKEERIEVVGFYFEERIPCLIDSTMSVEKYSLRMTKKAPEEKFPAIKSAIEAILNNNEFDIDWRNQPVTKKYFTEQDLINAFNAARETVPNPILTLDVTYKYPTFNDYAKTIKQ